MYEQSGGAQPALGMLPLFIPAASRAGTLPAAGCPGVPAEGVLQSAGAVAAYEDAVVEGDCEPGLLGAWLQEAVLGPANLHEGACRWKGGCSWADPESGASV